MHGSPYLSLHMIKQHIAQKTLALLLVLEPAAYTLPPSSAGFSFRMQGGDFQPAFTFTAALHCNSMQHGCCLKGQNAQRKLRAGQPVLDLSYLIISWQCHTAPIARAGFLGDAKRLRRDNVQSTIYFQSAC